MRRVWTLTMCVFVASLGLCWFRALSAFPYDYAINWTAAWQLRLGGPLYDQVALQTLGLQHVGPIMGQFFDVTYESFIGPPTTALFFLPFTFLSFTTSILFYRIVALLCLGFALYRAAVESESPLAALLCGVFCLLLWQPLQLSIDLGQLDGIIVLCLVGAMLASRRGAWPWVGGLAGAAAILKVSPGLVVVGMLRRSWSVLSGALILGLSLVLFLSAVGRLSDVKQFVTTVAPSLGAGTRYIENISLGASLARIADGGVGSGSYTAPIGGWRFLGLAFVGVWVLYRWWRPLRQAQWHVSELVILALLAGPITWDHYLVWSVPVLQFLAAQASFRRRIIVFIVAAACALPTLYQEPLVWYHATKTIALLGMLGLIAIADATQEQEAFDS